MLQETLPLLALRATDHLPAFAQHVLRRVLLKTEDVAVPLAASLDQSKLAAQTETFQGADDDAVHPRHPFLRRPVRRAGRHGEAIRQLMMMDEGTTAGRPGMNLPK